MQAEKREQEPDNEALTGKLTPVIPRKGDKIDKGRHQGIEALEGQIILVCPCKGQK